MSEVPGRPLTTLRRLARQAENEEQCELCAEPIPSEHQHVLHLDSRELQCVCRPCGLLFDGTAGRRRLVPSRVRFLPDFQMTDVQWASLDVPVSMAFFTHSSVAGETAAFYPSPMGATQSLLSFETWDELVKQNPVLREMAPDVDALLVNRIRGAREHFLVPIDVCYQLVGLIRAYWTGFSGGSEVWKQIDAFFAELHRRGGDRSGTTRRGSRPNGGAHA